MKQKSTNYSKRIFAVIGVVALLSSLVVGVLPTGKASAAQITNRSLTLQPGSSAGGSDPGGVVNHLFSFTLPTAGTVGSIQFTYCTTASGTCTTPAGLLTTSATLGTQTGATGFTLVNTTNGAPYVTRTAAAITAGTAVTIQLLSVTNPTTTNYSFYVRIASFATTDATGSSTDTGNVEASTATPIQLTGTMPESLVFCTGGTVSTTSGVPDCTTATAGTVSFNQLFSPTATATATSQMAASTNAGSGYAITVAGATLTSGANTITAMNTAGTSTLGLGQFGMNLMVNTTPAVGTAITPAADGVNYKGEPKPSSGYDVANTFKYTSGDTIADSANGGAGGTNAQIFTSSYIVNVPGNQPAGTYTTTLTYVCTPTF